MIFLFIFVAINCIFFLLLYYNLWAEKGRIHNYFRQLNCHVLDIKVIAMRSKRRDYNSYKVTYVDYAFNLFRINCTAASFGFGLNWSDRRFIRRLSEREIAELHDQFVHQTTHKLHDFRNVLDGKIQHFRENRKLRNLPYSISDEILVENQNSSKEKLLDGLQSELPAKRKETILQIGSLEQVDEVIIQRVQGLATTDPEPTVREAARQTLKELNE